MSLTDTVIMPGSHYQAICDAVRAKTGDTAVLKSGELAAAIAGIAGGGNSGLSYDMGEFVLDADISSNNAYIPAIPHNLGEVPDCIIVWSDNWAGITEAPYEDFSTLVGFMWFRELTGMIGRASSSVNIKNPIIVFMNIPKSDYRVSTASPTSASYSVNLDKLTATEFYTPHYGAANYWRGGVTYKYFVSKAWWNVGGVASAE